MASRRLKTKCEVCGELNKKVLDWHHLIPRSDPKSTNKKSNLALVCANCHRRIHALEIIAEGHFMTTQGMKFFWHYADESYIVRPGIILHKDGTATVLKEKDDGAK